MVIKYRKECTFGNLAPGDVFYVSNQCDGEILCMKTEDIDVGDSTHYNAVNLTDGSFDEFFDNAVIIIPRYAAIDARI